MGTIVERTRSDGTKAYTAQIRLKRNGKLVHSEADTFERRAAAAAWLRKREGELAQPGALGRDKSKDPPLSDVIDRYVTEAKRKFSRSKKATLLAIKRYSIAGFKCSEVTSDVISAFAEEIGRKSEPQTVAGYVSHLSAIFDVAKPLWQYPLDKREIQNAAAALRAVGTIGRSNRRDRRPTLEELDKLMHHFGALALLRRDAIPMQSIVAFAIFSTRRETEILHLRWDDLDEANSRILVRDMKHPGQKEGNDVYCELPPEALAIIRVQPKKSARIFPYSFKGVCSAFTRTCYAAGINTEEMPDKLRLRFHDLRHEGVSRLFELGRTIPLVAAVSGHRTWQNLARYTHIRQAGDKYLNWPWLDIVTSCSRAY
jgi:integrase